MIAIVCTLLSAIGFYFSIGLGEIWQLAWLAPVPVLWLAFGKTRIWVAFLAAFASYAIGSANLLQAYAGMMPLSVVILAIGGPAMIFAGAALAARRVQRRLGGIVGALAFASLWTALDFLTSFSRAGGTVTTPAAAEVGAPLLVQSASLVGYLGVTFLLGAVSACLAVGVRERRLAPGLLALAIFVSNAAYGAWRMSAPPSGSIRVAALASNAAVGEVTTNNETAAIKAIAAYAAQVNRLQDKNLDLIVLPENIARIAPGWRDRAQAILAAAAAQATLVAGFNTNIDGVQHNVAWAFPPGTAPVTYKKRRLVVGLETVRYAPGKDRVSLSSGIALEICKDMDFQAMVRADIQANRPVLFAVPAWDFGADGWSHGRVAILRSVENGVPMARSARSGLLTLNDQYGRLVARATTGDGFTTIVGDIPLYGRGGQTFYSHIGDAWGWFCLALGASLWGWSFVPRRRAFLQSLLSRALRRH